jgi:ribonuclease D
VVAIDLENHHQTSYNGFLCLLQLTTPPPMNQTFLVDVLALRAHIRPLLGPIFESADIQKVFHGCLHSDVSWLQRDFGLTVVNVFDTQECYKRLLKG